MQRILLAAATACAVLLAPLLHAQAPEPARDPADLRPVMPKAQAEINARIAALKAEVVALPERSRERGLKQIEYGYALMSQGNDIDRAAGMAAANGALRVFDSAADPIPWAHAQALKAIFTNRQHGTLANRAADNAAKAALTVFTKDAHPLQYVEVKCAQSFSKLLATVEDNSIGALSSNSFIALAPICSSLVFGDGQGESAAQLHATLRGFTFTIAALRSQLGGGLTTLLAAADQTGGAAALFKSGMLLDLFTGSRAAYLSGALAMDDLGLSPADKARALALRAQADAAAETSGRTGPAWRANRAVWTAYADLYEILAAPKPTMQEPPATPIPAIAPLMVDATRGAVAYKGTRNQGGVIATERGFSGGVLANLGRASDSGAAAVVVDNALKSTATEAWMAAYGRGDFSAAIGAFRTAFEPKWSPALRQAINEAGGRAGARVLLLPDGPASMLPLGLLRDPATGRMLIEDYEIVLAPSVGVYNRSLARAAQNRPRALALVAPAETESGLAFAAAETEIVASRFAGAVTRPEPKPAVLQALQQNSYWHFATHGGFYPDQPRASALLLAGDERLTLSDLFQSDRPLGAPRLVVLSACETGLFDATRDPDDFIGLPTGFLQSGAAGVIASLWPVSDVATALLMAKFYALHVGAGEAPPAALRHAQLWLKGADKAALTAFVQEEAARGGLSAARSALLITEIGATAGAAPFADPQFWGAFVYYGG